MRIWASPEEKFVLVLESALRSFDEENAGAPDAHPLECDCKLCEFVAATRKTVAEWRERER